MSKTLLAAAITVAGVAGTGLVAADISEQILPEASSRAADSSIIAISDAAYALHLLGVDWSDALKQTVETSRRNSAITVNGTTLTWQVDDQCYQYQLPTPDSQPEQTPCR
jgi:hypothetical protein